MIKNLTCILCPNGCELTAETERGAIVRVTGNRCKRGLDYVEQELIHPMRTIATSVAVRGGVFPLCSVRLTAPIPKDRIFDIMREIKKLRLFAPVFLGQTLLADVLGLGSDVIATKSVPKESGVESEQRPYKS